MSGDDRVIELCWSPEAAQVRRWTLRLPEAGGWTIAQAWAALPEADRPVGVQPGVSPVGVWGRQHGWETVLRAGDRVEFYGPLRVDPKVARRERYFTQQQSGRVRTRSRSVVMPGSVPDSDEA
jgi:putative ubiquitin-RnfH superfamily antitoxin RatB of RatAB toxin-antitoxin module